METLTQQQPVETTPASPAQLRQLADVAAHLDKLESAAEKIPSSITNLFVALSATWWRRRRVDLNALKLLNRAQRRLAYDAGLISENVLKQIFSLDQLIGDAVRTRRRELVIRAKKIILLADSLRARLDRMDAKFFSRFEANWPLPVPEAPPLVVDQQASAEAMVVDQPASAEAIVVDQPASAEAMVVEEPVIEEPQATQSIEVDMKDTFMNDSEEVSAPKASEEVSEPKASEEVNEAPKASEEVSEAPKASEKVSETKNTSSDDSKPNAERDPTPADNHNREEANAKEMLSDEEEEERRMLAAEEEEEEEEEEEASDVEEETNDEPEYEQILGLPKIPGWRYSPEFSHQPTEEGVVVFARLDGVRRENLQIETDPARSTLTVRGVRYLPVPRSATFTYRWFETSLAISKNLILDQSSIRVALRNNMLCIFLRRRPVVSHRPLSRCASSFQSPLYFGSRYGAPSRPSFGFPGLFMY